MAFCKSLGGLLRQGVVSQTEMFRLRLCSVLSGTCLPSFSLEVSNNVAFVS
uniref:Uncharacterized protein n=1 Tax=Brassica oleracea TaxID=3712 RepID=A0A3P6FT29_BRAOL|nr:unnamed protein product [Brassica oleracea]